jgi:uncharacterized peroxidase-related enzyme
LHDLRSEVDDQEMVDRFAADWRTAGLDASTVALLSHAEKLTRTPSECSAADIEGLREAGWSDRGITDAVQVCAYFNYINRIAEGLGVDDEQWLAADGREAPDT